MTEENILKKLVEAIVDLKIENVKALALEAVKNGITAHKVIENGISQGLEIVGKKFEEKEYFLPELITAGLAAKEGLAVLEPYLKTETTKASGVIVIGTVKGDLHDIGKNIVVNLLKSAGFKVHDLGVDVPAEKFVEMVQKTNANILALSALLTTTMPEMKKVIDMLKAKSLKNKTKVVIGGRPVTPEFAEDIGADFYCKNAMDGLKKVKEILILENRQCSNI
ncbi:corrinoid protein [Candidatus Bathyarchaeota archaeon]|nr:corrinoid protein [Candidatus Bathyarchaeota archaeon]